jgi:peptidoglycan/LPS O-acetylase OafA/YrhL
MENITQYLIFRILPALLVTFCAIYLVFLRLNPAKRQATLHKIKKGTPAYDMYTRVYSTSFMAGSILIAATFILGIAFDLFRSAHAPSLFVLGAVLTVSILASLLGLYFNFFKRGR